MRSSEILFYDFDEFRLEVEKQLLLKKGQPVTLTHKAFQTLLILVQNSGQIVEKEDIFATLWADSFVEEANLTQYVYVLRKTLGRKSDGQHYIETVARRGYIFKTTVKTVLSESLSPIQETSFATFHSASKTNGHSSFGEAIREDFARAEIAPPDKLNRLIHQTNLEVSDSPADNETNGVRWMRSLIFVSAAGAILITLSLLFYFQNQKPAETKINSLAILPFKPIGEESKNDKLGLGMADAVITRLSKLPEIPVRPTSSVFKFTDQADVNPWTAGRELNVDAVLEGSVQREGDAVRVSVRLIKVAGGQPLWADNFDEKFTNMFALQDAISSKVARAIELNLSGAQEHLLTRRATADPAAYQAYSFGIYFWNKRTKDGLNKAVEYFERAIELDPNYAEAYAGLADSYNLLGHYNFADPGETQARARPAAEKALALNDQLAEAHTAMAYIEGNEQNFDAALRSLERAIALAPYNSTAHIRYGWQLLRMRKLPETVEQMRLAQQYDPLSPLSNNTLCTVLTLERNFAEAVGYCEKSVELAPDAPLNRLSLANAYYFDGRVEDAIAVAQTEFESGREKSSALGSLAFFYAKTGRTAEATEIFERLKRENESEELTDLVIVGYALGQKDQAFARFKQAYEKKALPFLFFPYDPSWDEVKADPRVAELIK